MKAGKPRFSAAGRLRSTTPPFPAWTPTSALCAEAERDYEGFWARLARENLAWQSPFTKTLDESDAPFYKWFADGKLNVSYNCLDRNLDNGNADKTAIIFEADDGKVTRADLPRAARAASASSPTA